MPSKVKLILLCGKIAAGKSTLAKLLAQRQLPGKPTDTFMRDAKTRGETPLHRAALFGRPETIALLLDAGANPDAQDAFGETPLAWASWARRPVEVLRALLYANHRIHPEHKSMRANLLGTPDDS